MGFGGRSARWLEVDPRVVETARAGLLALFRSSHAPDHARLGWPIDVSPTHLPIFGSRNRVHHGFGFTGNGVGPTHLGGEILARLP